MTSTSERCVAVTGLGAVSPLGNDAESSWQAALAGKSGIGPITRFDASAHQTRIAGEVKDFDPASCLTRKEVRRTDRFTHLALTAAKEALAHAGILMESEDPRRVGALIGSAVGGLELLVEQIQALLAGGPRRVGPFAVTGFMSNAASAQVSLMLGARGSSLGLATACASGSNALGEAAAIIKRGDVDVMIAGGSEAGLVPIALAAFNSMHAMSTRNEDPTSASRPFDRDRDGFVVGEGAAVLILEEMERAKARGATILAELAGYGSTNDGFHIAQPAEDGVGAMEVMQMALDCAGLPADAVDYINAHGTSTKLNDAVESLAISRVLGSHAQKVAVSSTKSMTGHLLGAAGALEAMFCVQAIRDSVIPPTINYTTPDPDCVLDYVPNQAREMRVDVCLSNSFGLGGHNASVLLRRV